MLHLAAARATHQRLWHRMLRRASEMLNAACSKRWFCTELPGGAMHLGFSAQLTMSSTTAFATADELLSWGEDCGSAHTSAAKGRKNHPLRLQDRRLGVRPPGRRSPGRSERTARMPAAHMSWPWTASGRTPASASMPGCTIPGSCFSVCT
jgi:hypothetical protein